MKHPMYDDLAHYAISFLIASLHTEIDDLGTKFGIRTYAEWEEILEDALEHFDE